jgi:hypothetical protein
LGHVQARFDAQHDFTFGTFEASSESEAGIVKDKKGFSEINSIIAQDLAQHANVDLVYGGDHIFDSHKPLLFGKW